MTMLGWLLLGLVAPAAAQDCRIEETPLVVEGCGPVAPVSDFVFYNPPCEFVAGPYPDTEASAIPHHWPLPGGAVPIEIHAGLGTCHGRITVRHTGGRRVRGRGAVDLDAASCAELRRLAVTREADTFTVESSAGQRMPERYLQAEHVEWIKAVGGAHLTLDVAVRRSADLALLAPIADRITSLRVRAFDGRGAIDVADLPPIPCLRALAVEAPSVSGLGSLRGSASLEALEVDGRLEDAEVAAIAGIASLRELRVWPTGRAVSAYSAIRQIERLHTTASAPVLEAFAGAPLRRLVLRGSAGVPALGVVARFTALEALDVTLAPAVRRLDIGPLTGLRSLLVTWSEAPPRIASLPALAMLVASGAFDQRFVRWMNAQRRLRTVHTEVTDEVLRPLLPRAHVYTIGRYPFEADIPEWL